MASTAAKFSAGQPESENSNPIHNKNRSRAGRKLLSTAEVCLIIEN
jgi:hypothetical protein